MNGSGQSNLRTAVPFIVLIALLGTACGAPRILDARAQSKSTAITVTAVPADSSLVKSYSPAASAKPLFVEFYTTWCAPCVQMMPTINRLQDEYGNRVNFDILDAAGASEEKAKYHYVSQPQIVLVDRQGKIVDTIYGLQGYDGLKTSIDKLLTTP